MVRTYSKRDNTTRKPKESPAHDEGHLLEKKEADRPHAASAACNFIAYPKAMQSLSERFGATPDELAIWIFLGPDLGGIAAYLNANELPDPPRFYFSYFIGKDYLAPMMACWFRQDEIDGFEPKDHYITGKQLIERWGKLPNIQAEPFIRAKIAESRLQDLHPCFGGTRGTFSEQPDFPPLTAGIFALSEIKKIEAEDFDSKEPLQECSSSSPCNPAEAWRIRKNFRVKHDEDENEAWWKTKMADAKKYGLLECRFGEGRKSTGSLWRPDVIAGWLIHRHESGREGLNCKDAARALKKFPGCDEIADLMCPEEA